MDLTCWLRKRAKKKVVLDVENSLKFCDSVIDVFTKKKLSNGRQVQGEVKWRKAQIAQICIDVLYNFMFAI
jgi:hypothetical protein